MFRSSLQKIVSIGALFCFSFTLPQAALGAPSSLVSRGAAVSSILEAFELKTKEASFIAMCLSHPDECFFTFSAMSRYDDIGFTPLRLYPDVTPAYRHADSIHLATMLGLVHGCVEEKNSPFYPRMAMRRIDALKVVLGASGLLPWKERFELVELAGGEENFLQAQTPYADVALFEPGQWWYPRYVNFAYEAGILPKESLFRPEAPITERELKDFIVKALAAAQP